MDIREAQNIAETGTMMAVGVAVIPTAVTATLATAQIVLIRIIGEVILRTLTLGILSLTYLNGIPSPFPLMWRFSMLSFKAGCVVALVSGLTATALAYHQGERPFERLR